MATGTYHKFNFLKFRMLEALFDAYPASLTSKAIADNGDIELKKVADALNHYIAGNYSYITRLKKKSNEGKYRYKINTSGAEAYLQYKHRIKLGFDLNRHRRVPKRVDSYYDMTKKGALELGLVWADEEAQPIAKNG